MRYYEMPKERYLEEPAAQTCYEYMRECSAKIIDAIGDYEAVVCYGGTVHVKQLIDESDRLAAYFASKGVQAGDVYGVFLPTSYHAFTAFYALNKIGAIAYFIHPMTPPAALKAMLEAVSAKGVVLLDMFVPAFGEVLTAFDSVVCSASDCGPLPDQVGDKFKANPRICRYLDAISSGAPAVAARKGTGKELAAYMNGGGTTGRSKTVMISSYAINSGAYYTYLLDTPHEYGTCYSLAVLPCFHAFGLCDTIHYAICNAYTAICMPKFDAHAANDIVSKYKVSHIIGVPNMFVKMFHEDNFVNPGLKNLSHLYAGGDALNEKFREDFNAVLSANNCSGRLTAGYGMTEMCAIVTANNYHHNKDGAIGFPYEGIDLRIVDDDGKTLPAGTIGEILAKGGTMMEGYLPDGYVKESGFFLDENGEKWVASGDMGYLDEDGFLFFSGRKKRIFIISGYNIYPSTIEEQVAALPFIREVCAVQGKDENGKILVKLCVSLKDESVSAADAKAQILAFCEKNLDSICVPRRIEVLEALPRTKMDKIDFLSLSEY